MDAGTDVRDAGAASDSSVVVFPPTDNLFGAFHFTIEGRPPDLQIDLLMAAGYGGIMIQWPGVEAYRRFADHPAVRTGAFAIVAVLTDLNTQVPVDADRIAGMARELAATRTALWTLVAGEKDRDKLVATVSTAADAAKPFGVDVVVYPHDQFAIEDVSESLPVVMAAARSNLKTSIHLCHEFKAGNRDRLAAVISQAAGWIALASINGTHRDADTSTGWDRGILPLDEGDFDVRNGYLRPLVEAGYRGPILLHTFGITQPPEEHYVRSMRWWRRPVDFAR